MTKRPAFFIFQKHVGKPFISFEELVSVFWRVAVTPAAVVVGQFDSAVLGNPIRSIVVRLSVRKVNENSVIFFKSLAESFGILLVPMDIESIGNYVEISACIYYGAGIILTFNDAVNGFKQSVVLS